MEDRIGKWTEGLARRATRRDVGGWLLRLLLGGGLMLLGGGRAFAKARCRHLKGGCGRCGWYGDGCGGFPMCEKRKHHCEAGGIECPEGCQYRTFWSCCCQGVVYRCTDCVCNQKVCICRGATENIC
jgi:hypothetical protein